MKYLLGSDTPPSEAILVVQKTGASPDCLGCETLGKVVSFTCGLEEQDG
jgi:hypothetical protein